MNMPNDHEYDSVQSFVHDYRILDIKTSTLYIFIYLTGMTMSDEKRLTKYLLQNYERVGVAGRPVYTVDETVQVQFGLTLLQINDMVKVKLLTRNQYLTQYILYTVCSVRCNWLFH